MVTRTGIVCIVRPVRANNQGVAAVEPGGEPQSTGLWNFIVRFLQTLQNDKNLSLE